MGALYYVPIIHGTTLKNMFLHALRNGKTALANGLEEVNKFEAMLQDKVPSFFGNSGQDLRELDIKVDGLVDGSIGSDALGYPVVARRGINCVEALDICKQLAANGSVVHKIIVDLCSRGAKVWGTENPDIIRMWNLYEEFNELEEGVAKDLIIDRDQYIASEIKYVGRSNRSVLCFMGAAHDVPLRLEQRGVVFSLVHPISRQDIENTIPTYSRKDTYFDKLPLR